MDEAIWPPDLAGELDRRGWRLMETEPLAESASGAHLFRLHVADGFGRRRTLLLKRPAPPSREADFYREVLAHFPDHSLTPLGIFGAPFPAVLLPDLGPTVKERWDALEASAQTALALDLARFLADFHEAGRHLPEAVRKRIPPYPRDSSERWASRALHALRELAAAGRVDAPRIDALARMANDVYGSRGVFDEGAAAVLHGDPHFANLCLRKDGRYALIDWEYLELGPPVRDLTVMLLDVADESLHPAIRAAWAGRLLEHGWSPSELGSDALYATVSFDNTLMMAGFEIGQAKASGRPWSAVGPLLERRLNRLEDVYRRLA